MPDRKSRIGRGARRRNFARHGGGSLRIRLRIPAGAEHAPPGGLTRTLLYIASLILHEDPDLYWEDYRDQPFNMRAARIGNRRQNSYNGALYPGPDFYWRSMGKTEG